MGRSFRRSAIGLLAGAVSSIVLVFTMGRPAWSLVCGVVVGVLYSLGLPPTRGTYVDQLMAGGAFGVPLWGVISVITIPLLTGAMPEWSAEKMRAHFPSLVGWVLCGASLGVCLQALQGRRALQLRMITSGAGKISPEVAAPRDISHSRSRQRLSASDGTSCLTEQRSQAGVRNPAHNVILLV